MRQHANHVPQGTADEACVSPKPFGPGKQPGFASHTMHLLQGVVSPGVLHERQRFPEDLDSHPILEDDVLRDCGCSSVAECLRGIHKAVGVIPSTV